MSESNATAPLGNSVSQNPAPVATKRVGRPPLRRPKAIPVKTRQRLANLGVEAASSDTTEANLKHIIHALSADLRQYTLQADHWQTKLKELQESEKHAQEARNNASTTAKLEIVKVNKESSFSPALSKFEYELLRKLQNTAEPTLHAMTLPDPRVRTSVTMEYSDFHFTGALSNISRIGTLFGVFKGNRGAWSDISRLKPDFDVRRARQVWDHLFSSIDTTAAAFDFASGPTARKQLITWSNHHDNEDDYDALDHTLSKATDAEVLDLLHYCSLLLLGLTHSTYDDHRLDEPRDHMTRQMERLLREAVFMRNIYSSSEYAADFVVSSLDTIYNLAVLDRKGAVNTVLDMAWAACQQHQNLIHPILKSIILFESTVWAPSQAKRATWMARNQENLNSSEQPYFHLASTAYFTACFYALSVRDEDLLLHYLAKLEALLEPPGRLTAHFDFPSGSPDESSVTGPFFEDPTSYWVLGNPTIPHEAAEQFSDWAVRVENFAHITAPPPPTHSPSSPPSRSLDSTTQSSDTTIQQHLDLCTGAEIGTPIKTTLRSSLALLRAEASLLHLDYDTCRSWVDEAERIMSSMDDILIFQKMLLTEVPSINAVFGTPCPFPSGTRTVAEELLHRITIISEKRKMKA